MEDAAGEFTNIVLGQAKSELNKLEGYTIEKAIPSIICGEQTTVNHKGADGSLLIPFETDKGMFYLEICIENN
jgi:chemotaxis protein CheX